jgi:hypothetical protein
MYAVLRGRGISRGKNSVFKTGESNRSTHALLVFRSRSTTQKPFRLPVSLGAFAVPFQSFPVAYKTSQARFRIEGCFGTRSPVDPSQNLRPVISEVRRGLDGGQQQPASKDVSAIALNASFVN